MSAVGKAGAIFNIEKLQWMNGVYIRDMAPARLTSLVADRLDRDLPEARPLDEAYLGRVVPLVQDRLKLLSEARELTEFFLVDEIVYNPEGLVQKKMDEAGTLRALEAAESRLDGLPGFEAEALETALRALAEELEVKTGQLFGTLRRSLHRRKGRAAPLRHHGRAGPRALYGPDRQRHRVDAGARRGVGFSAMPRPGPLSVSPRGGEV